jgi:Zn-dependent peptidase ImmA (M78 family)/DNA-binding XRE family transcriptional regulator
MFQHSRLTLLREREGLTKEQFAQRCGVSRRTVTEWESGRVENPPTHLIASLFGIEEDFFFGEELDEIKQESVSFRALSTMTAKQTRQVLSSARISLRFLEWIEQHYNTAPLDLPVLDTLVPQVSNSDPSPQEASELLRSYWSLGDGPVRNMLTLLERHGVRVFALPPGEREVDAFSFWRGGQALIFLNLDKSAERMRFDLAHELGHLFMHKGIPTARDKIYEHEANAFASAFLLPWDGLLSHANTSTRALRLSDVYTLKLSWRVSALAMVRRLRDMGLINDWQYRTWVVDLSKKGFRRGEPDGIRQEMSLFLRETIECAKGDGYSLRRIAAELKLPIRDLEMAVAGLAMVPISGGRSGRSQVPPEYPSDVLHELPNEA